MEHWEAIIEHPLEHCHRTFEKVLETASALLNVSATQLAPFETEWLIQTLLYAPVELVATVSRRRGEEAWRKAVADALRLLARVADVCEHRHYEHIVDVCLLSYDPELRKHALACLAAVARRSDVGARDAARHVQALEEAGQCRAPIALLVGALCEHHPAAVCDEITRVWRGFLNMLDNTKNTDTVTKAVLEGICGLLKHFGDELPCSELAHLYGNLSTIYINKAGCQAACYSILAGHAALFKERAAPDRALRRLLWGAAPPAALLAVYAATAQCVSDTELISILTTEVLPHTQSPSYQTKMAALRVLAATKTGFGDLSQHVDVYALEYELRREKVSHADAELVLWCVEYNLPNSERLLQAAILFYDNLPPARKRIVASGIANSPPELRRAAIQFLIACTCEDEGAKVWRDLFDDDGAAATAVVRELAGCLLVMLEAVGDDLQELPPKLSALLRLASLVPIAHAAPLYVCGPLLRGLASHAPALRAAQTLLAGACGQHFYESIRIDRCRDEATLHAACVALAQAPNDVRVDPDNLLCALQIIFTSDVEPKIHGAALRKLDHLLTSDQCLDVDTRHAIRAVEKLRARGDRTDRDVRVLHREATMFLGKHGNVDTNNKRDSWDDAIVVDLKTSLVLTLPYQGTSYKVDLKSMLLLTLQHEDPSALQTFLAMLCANLSSNKALNTQRAVVRVVRALALAHACGGGARAEPVRRAVRMCGDGAADLLQYISGTKSCGARKLLAGALASLCEEPDVLRSTAEGACVMLASADSTTKCAGLDIAETLLTSLENNHSLSKTILPELTILVANTYESETKTIFDMASKSFIDKKELFDEETIRQTIRSLLENLLKTNLSDVKIYKVTVKMTIEFVKSLRDVKLEAIEIFDSKSIDVKALYVLAVLKSEIGFDSDLSRKILGRDNLAVIHSLLNLSFDDNEAEFFTVEVILRFLEEYSEVVLELKYKETLQFISEVIARFTPTLVKQLHKTIKLCFTSLNRHWRAVPKTILSSVQSWVEMLPIKKITDAIDRDNFLPEHHMCVDALRIMSNVFDMREMNLSDVKMYISKWPSALLKLYASGRLEEYFIEELSYFNDILTVSLRFLITDDVKKFLKADKNGILFCGFFVEGFFEVLTENPFILLDEELKGCSVVLNDMVRLVVKKTGLKERYENVLELVDKLWPAYEQHATFVQKHCLLANLQSLGPGPESNPLQWATRVVCSREAALDERVKLLAFIPEESFKLPEVAAAACSLFPARMRELSPALLEAAAARPGALLPTVAALAANDSSTGWWDVALESCLASVAKRNNFDLCVTLFHKCHSERACERVLVPLLRHSSTEVCERFLASILDQVLGNLKKRPKGAVHLGYQKRFEDYMFSLHMLLVAFEKLPTSSLESASSVLYGGSPVPPWHLVREACRWCHSLRDTRCTDQQVYRKLQCMLYNCMCAAICRRRPPLALYSQLLSADTLANIVDSQELVLPIRASWTHRNKTLPVAVPLEPSTLSPSHTQRSRIFLRTLSEDPMLFDLHSSEEEVMEVQDISLRETPLNAHACAGTLTALLRHVAGAPALASLWPALARLLADASDNLKWLLAQIICNCKEELKPHASALLPGLLAVLASVEEGKCMNGLHVDVLDTIIFWKEPTNDDLHVITYHLITTCMENRRVLDALLRTLQAWLELYGGRVEWRSFEKYYEDQQHDTQKALFQLVKTILKTKIYIPQILSKIVAKLDTNPAKLSECFGLAMAACQDGGEKGEALGGFRKYLEKCNVITNYVRMLYYSSLGAAECCGEQEFRKIADYATKVTSSDRTKCLHVLSAYLSRGRRSGYVADMFDTVHLSDMIDKDPAALLLVKNGLPLMSEALRRRCIAQVSALRPAAPKVRRLAVEVMLQAYEELFTQPPQPPAKRQKTETTSILSVSRDDVYSNSILTCLGMYAVDSDADVARAARDGLGAKLDKELGARFAECFLLTLYLPAHTDRTPDLCVCVSALLDLLLGGLRAAEGFKELRLRDEPLPDIQEPDSRLLALSRTCQGTFGSYSATRGRIRAQPGSGAAPGSDTYNAAIDVQMPIDSILETLLEFAKTTPEAARALLTEAVRSVLAASKFDVASTLVPLLGTLLAEPTDLTPLHIDVARALLGNSVESLLSPVERLRTVTAGTEGAELAQLLYEEVAMRCEGDAMFQLGQTGDFPDVAMDGTAPFSIEDLKSAFGKLSNWDDLTLQQRRAAKTSLPPLWTERRDFVARLDSYQVHEDAQCWFDKMAAAFKQDAADSWRWLRAAERWPRRRFEISAITEALSWQHEPSEAPPSHVFNTSDCVAESAARLMVRSSYYASLQHSETNDRINKLSRSHELKWCVRANEMGIPSAVLQCVERNVEELSGVETLPWLRQKLVALRQVALSRQDTGLLQDVLKKSEKYTPQLSSDPAVSIEMYQLMLQLHTDLKSLTQPKLQTILAEVGRAAPRVAGAASSREAAGAVFHTAMAEVGRAAPRVAGAASSREAAGAVFHTAMAYYDEALDTGAMDAESALASMSRVVSRAAALHAPATDLLLAVLLNRLTGSRGRLPESDLVDKLAPFLPTLDAFTLELLEKNSSKLPGLQDALAAQPRASAHKHRRCLQLVCDPGHLLTRYCEELVHALRDKDAGRWKSVLDKMRDKIFDNPYAGASYKLLDKYKDDLYGNYAFEPTPEFASRAEAKLKSIILSARREPQSTLRLADLCPSLLGPLEGSGIERLFGLEGVKVVKFYDKVQVFTDSIRRPVVVSMLLSSGRTYRVLHKTGEPLARDAAAQRVAARCTRAAYSVTLLDEESALIEYLEGHERLRSMIASTCDLDVLHTVSRPAEHGLLEAPAASLRAHRELCARVPAHALRSAMELNSSCVQDFICKKQNFTDSLADMTLLTWLLGLGDRHLQNIMCSLSGHVRSVDWGDVWRRAASPPARLSRNLLALANMQVLEARLQSRLAAMRGSALLLEACARAAFHWMGPELDDQMQHVRGILRGTATSYDVARDVTSRSRLNSKEKYLELLDRALGGARQDRYSVEEQVSCLLRHGTAPELLSVARAGWEPWV